MTTLKYRNSDRQKPKLIVDYNRSKAYIDMSDQMKSYNSPLRKDMKWYRKLAIELILGIAVINAHIVYKSITHAKVTITEFREKILERIISTQTTVLYENPSNNDHKLILGTRRRCVACYNKLSIESTATIAWNKATRSTWRCLGCDKNFCVECFFLQHSSTLP